MADGGQLTNNNRMIPTAKSEMRFATVNDNRQFGGLPMKAVNQPVSRPLYDSVPMMSQERNL